MLSCSMNFQELTVFHDYFEMKFKKIGKFNFNEIYI